MAIYHTALRQRSFESLSGILGWMLSLTKKEFDDFSVNGQKALGIGTGPYFMHAIGLYVCGYSEVVSVDKYRLLNTTAVKIAFKTSVLARRFLSMHISHDTYMKRMKKIEETGLDLGRLESLGISYRGDFDLVKANELKHSFDFVYSYTVWEHPPISAIDDFVEAAIFAMKPGGYCVHLVDLEDHQNNLANPFGFLSADITWKEEDSYLRGNRLRFSSWKKMLRKHTNIDWRFPYVAVRNDAPLPDSIDGRIEYENEQDLRTAAFVVVGKRLS